MVEDDHTTHPLSDEDPLWLLRVEHYLDGAATEEELALLRQELSASSAKREAFMRMADILASLTEWSAADRGVVGTHVPSLDELPVPPATFLGLFRSHTAALRWAAVLVLAIGLAVVLTLSLRGNSQAIFVAGTDIEWGGSMNVKAGAPLPEGVIHLARGCASLRMTKASLLVEGPAEFLIESPTRVKLVMGKLTANVTDASSHFTIATDSAQVTDLGTEFGVSVGAAGDTEVLVFRGAVALAPASGTEQSKVTLHAAEGGRVEMNRSVVTAASGSVHFFRSLDEVQLASATTMPSAVLAWWRFEDAAPLTKPGARWQANVVADSSGHNNALNWRYGRDDGSMADRFSSEVPPASMFRTGLSGGTRSFMSAMTDGPSGAGALYYGAQKRSSPFFFFDGSFTFEAYFKTAGDRSHAGMLTILTPHDLSAQPAAPQYRLGLNGDEQDSYGTGAIGLTVLDKTMKDVSVVLSDANFADGKWHYVAAFYDAANARIRLLAIDEDGSRHENAAAVPNRLALPASQSANLLIGCSFGDVGEDVGGAERPGRFHGLLDEIRISSGVIPDAELMAAVAHPRSAAN